MAGADSGSPLGSTTPASHSSALCQDLDRDIPPHTWLNRPSSSQTGATLSTSSSRHAADTIASRIPRRLPFGGPSEHKTALRCATLTGMLKTMRGGQVNSGTERRGQWLHRWVWLLFDAAIWFLAIFGATWLRFDFGDARVFVGSTLIVATVAATAHLVIGAAFGPYAVGHRRGSFEETTQLARAAVITTTGLLAWAFVASPMTVPRSVPVVAGALALVGMFAARFSIRS